MSSGCVVATISTTSCEPRLRLDGGELVAERLRLRGAERAGLVDHAARQRRHRQQALRLRQPHRPQQGGGEQRAASGASRFHFDAGLSKLTAGGCEICASFCTVKLGLTE